jgi:hypothetical protein
MTPQRLPLAVYRGDTHRWVITVWADPAATVPVDLTGAQVAAEVRSAAGSPVLAVLDCAVTPPNTITVGLAPAASAALPGGPAGWDLQVTFPDGFVRTLAAGPVTVTADVTDSVPVPA